MLRDQGEEWVLTGRDQGEESKKAFLMVRDKGLHLLTETDGVGRDITGLTFH